MGLTQAYTLADFRDLLLRLSPPGWAFGPGARWEELLAAFAAEWERVQVRQVEAGDETDPRTCDETVETWERQQGVTSPMTLLADRQAEIYARVLAVGGVSVAYFVAVAAGLGVAITIIEPLSVGWSCSSPPCFPLYDVTARFIWLVDGPAATSAVVRAALEALFNGIKPAHTRVYFTWT